MMVQCRNCWAWYDECSYNKCPICHFPNEELLKEVEKTKNESKKTKVKKKKK